MAQADETAAGAMELGQETESARRRTGWAAAGGTLGALGYGFYTVYWKPMKACAEGAAGARPLPGRTVKTALWVATLLVVAAVAFPYLAPALLGV